MGLRWVPLHDKLGTREDAKGLPCQWVDSALRVVYISDCYELALPVGGFSPSGAIGIE